MKTLYCDICKGEIEDPIPGRTIYFFKEYDICDDCKDVVDARLRPIVRAHFPYSAEWYEQQVIAFLERGAAVSKP